MTIKLNGPRSLKTKLQAIAKALEDDSYRVRTDHLDDRLANSLMAIARTIDVAQSTIPEK